MFFDDEDLSTGFLGNSGDTFLIDGLNAEKIDKSDVLSVSLDLLDGLSGFKQSDTSRDDNQLVAITLVQDLALTNFEFLVIGVDDFSDRSGGSDVGVALVVGSEADSSFAGDGIGGIEDSSTEEGSEHGKIFKTHLGGTVFTEGDTSMGADVVDLGV